MKKDITWRSILIGSILILPNNYWIMQVEGVWNTGHSTCLSLMWHVVINLLVLTLINVFILRKFSPKHALTEGDLIVIYSMLTLGACVSGRDMLQILVPVMAWPFWFATPENEWAQLFHNYIPRWLTVSDSAVLRDFFEGKSSFYLRQNFLAWLTPIIWWSIFIVVLGFSMLCINVIIRKQWTRERLSYPIIQLPIAITKDGGSLSFFRDRLLLMGFIGSALLDILNGLHFFFPLVPNIPVSYLDHDLGKYFTSKPWNAIGSLRLPLYPFAIALGFFLPLDLSFSIWFFYLFRKAQQVVGSALGLQSLPNFPYLNQQSSGAWIGLFFVAIWLSRDHLRGVLRTVVNSDNKLDADEPLSYRSSIMGLIISMSFLTLFCYKAGMSLTIIIPFFLIFFMLSIAITRMRAELGPPTHELVNMNSGNILVDILGTRRVGANNLSIFPLFWFFSGRGYRSHLMPHQLESFKMAERAEVSGQRLVLGMIIAILLGALSAFWALLHLSFKWGMSLIPIGHDSGVYSLLQNRLNNPTSMDVPSVIFMCVGMLFTFLLMFLRANFIWWSLHPAGYALSMNFGIDYIWSCLVFSSLIKWLVLKFGGLKLQRRAMVFFFGVILGEYCVGGFWSLLSVILQQRTYDFYHA